MSNQLILKDSPEWQSKVTLAIDELIKLAKTSREGKFITYKEFAILCKLPTDYSQRPEFTEF